MNDTFSSDSRGSRTYPCVTHPTTHEDLVLWGYPSSSVLSKQILCHANTLYSPRSPIPPVSLAIPVPLWSASRGGCSCAIFTVPTLVYPVRAAGLRHSSCTILIRHLHLCKRFGWCSQILEAASAPWRSKAFMGAAFRWKWTPATSRDIAYTHKSSLSYVPRLLQETAILLFLQWFFIVEENFGLK